MKVLISPMYGIGDTLLITPAIKVLKKTSLNGIKEFIKELKNKGKPKKAIDFEEVENIIGEVLEKGVPKEIEGDEQDLQEKADLIEKYGLVTELVGLKPHMRLIIYPRRR